MLGNHAHPVSVPICAIVGREGGDSDEGRKNRTKSTFTINELFTV